MALVYEITGEELTQMVLFHVKEKLAHKGLKPKPNGIVYRAPDSSYTLLDKISVQILET